MVALSSFRIPLPIAEDAEEPRLPITVKRVLVVDDQFINRTILERQLVPCGIAVTLCRSGAEALLALERAGLGAALARWPRVFGHCYTLLAVLVTWVFFRANSLAEGMRYLQAMFAQGSPDRSRQWTARSEPSSRAPSLRLQQIASG